MQLFSCIRALECQVNFVSEKKLLIITNAEVVANATGVIGNPQTLNPSPAGTAVAPTAQATAAVHQVGGGGGYVSENWWF